MRNAPNEATVIRVARVGSIRRNAPSNAVPPAGGDPMSRTKWSKVTPGCVTFSCLQLTSSTTSGVVFAKRTQPSSKSKVQKSLDHVFVARTWLETLKELAAGGYETGSGERCRDPQK
jgi:hypothetical protein